MNKLLPIAVIALNATVVSTAVQAAEATNTMGVSATVSRTCTVTAEDIAFGTITQTGGAETTSAVAISCTAGSSTDIPTVTFSGGGNLDTGGSGLRQMIGGVSGTFVPYTLAAATGGTNLAPADTVTPTKVGTGTSYTTTVYSSVPAGAYDDIGAYSDTVTVTVTYVQ